MTLRLRAVHRHTWFALALLLPILWVVALRSLPDPVHGDPFRFPQPAALPNLLAQRETTDLLLSLRADTASRQGQLEILIKKPISSPALAVYWNDRRVGLLQNKGIYRFALDSASAQGQVLIKSDVTKTDFLKLNFR